MHLYCLEPTQIISVDFHGFFFRSLPCLSQQYIFWQGLFEQYKHMINLPLNFDDWGELLDIFQFKKQIHTRNCIVLQLWRLKASLYMFINFHFLNFKAAWSNSAIQVSNNSLNKLLRFTKLQPKNLSLKKTVK